MSMSTAIGIDRLTNNKIETSLNYQKKIDYAILQFCLLLRY